MSIKKRAKVVERFNSPSVNTQPIPTPQCSDTESGVERRYEGSVLGSSWIFFFPCGCGRVRLVGDG